MRVNNPLRASIPTVFGMVFAAASFLSPSVASATVMTYMGIDDLVEESDVVVRGTVDQRRTFHDDNRGEVFTHTTLEVDETYLGSPGDEVVIEQWGGTHEGVTHRIPGDASFEAGEEVVVFLAENRGSGSSPHYLVGLAQSKFSVQRDGNGPTVRRDLREVAVKSGTPGGQIVDDLGVQTWSLKSFEAKLKSLIYAARGQNSSTENGGSSDE